MLLKKDDEDWDLDIARASFDLPGLLQRLSDQFDAASRLGGAPRCGVMFEGRSVFCEFVDRLRWLRGWYLAKAGGAGAGGAANGMIQQQHQQHQQQADSLMDLVLGQSAEQYDGLGFWQQLSDLTYGVAS